MKPVRGRTKPKIDPATLLPCMDYLHGDVLDGELEAACHYEFARESKVLREAARLRAKGKSGPEVYHNLAQIHADVSWILEHPWILIWVCPSFPQTGWNQLSAQERMDASCGFATTALQPLRMEDVRVLNALKVFKKFEELAKEAEQARERRVPVLAVLHNEGDEQREMPAVRALFTINFSRTKTQLINEFKQWLELPENQQRLARHKSNPTGKTGGDKDRLKDLAVWRLYRELGCEGAREFAKKHRKHDDAKCPRAFHDPRAGQFDKVPLKAADLYSEDSNFPKAKARAKAYRERLLPREYGVYAEEQKRRDAKIAKSWRKAFPQKRRKVSKKSS